MANIDLKPCPFCGCDMKIEAVTIDYIENALGDYSYCPHCGAKMDGGAEG